MTQLNSTLQYLPDVQARPTSVNWEVMSDLWQLGSAGNIYCIYLGFITSFVLWYTFLIELTNLAANSRDVLEAAVDCCMFDSLAGFITRHSST